MFDFFCKTKNFENILGNKCYYFLCEFKTYTNINIFKKWEKWENFLDVRPIEVIKFFIYKKWIKKATIEELIIQLAKTKDLKEYLKKKNIKVPQKKIDIISTIKNNGLLKDFKKYEKEPYYILSAIGEEITQNFEIKYAQDEKDIINRITSFLQQGKYEDAISFASYYIDNRFFEDSEIKGYSYFTKQNKKEILLKVTDLMTANPYIFKELNSSDILKIRIYTVISFLLGYRNNKNPLINKDKSFNYKYSLEDCIHLLKNYEHSLSQIRECKEEKNFRIKVCSGCSEPCESYNKLFKNKLFKPTLVPEVPNPECKLIHGCNCFLTITYEL